MYCSFYVRRALCLQSLSLKWRPKCQPIIATCISRYNWRMIWLWYTSTKTRYSFCSIHVHVVTFTFFKDWYESAWTGKNLLPSNNHRVSLCRHTLLNNWSTPWVLNISVCLVRVKLNWTMTRIIECNYHSPIKDLHVHNLQSPRSLGYTCSIPSIARAVLLGLRGSV